MGSYSRKIKRQNTVKGKAPRCCGQHMFMNKYGVYQCRKCGRQKFDLNRMEQNTEMANNSVDNQEDVVLENTNNENEA